MNFSSFTKNWKTTVMGLLMGGMNMYASGTKPAQVGLSLAMALVGILAKDNNVTGGSVQQ